MGKLSILPVILSFSFLIVIADLLIKKAALKQVFSVPVFLGVAGFIYFLSVFGWFFVFKRMEFLNAGIIFTLTFIISSTLISVFYLKEQLLPTEILGLFLAVVSIALMYRLT